MKFNKDQINYMDEAVRMNPTRMELTQLLYRNEFFMDSVAKLGDFWETQWGDIDRYINDKFIEVHGAKMNGHY